MVVCIKGVDLEVNVAIIKFFEQSAGQKPTKGTVQVFNRKLRRLLKDMHYASVVDTNLTRDNFTRHGLHTNPLGRERIAKIIGQTITTPSTNAIPPISLKWEEVLLATSNVETKMGFASKNDNGVHRNVARSSSREKRPPVTRNEDFLWVACTTKPV